MLLLGDGMMMQKIQTVPTIYYPESDGKPMAETDKHRDLMVAFIQMLQYHFRNKPVYVSGNLLMYYEQGNIKKCVAPDVFVVFGVSKKRRRTYLTWEEGNTPDFVLELASPSTFRQDMRRKKKLYASVLSVKEYYIYDPYGEINPYFIGFRLEDGEYQEIDFVNERLVSEVLDLELGEHNGILRLYDPSTEEWLQPPPERVEDAEERAQTAEERAQQETVARQNLEAELAKALLEIEQLREKLGS